MTSALETAQTPTTPTPKVRARWPKTLFLVLGATIVLAIAAWNVRLPFFAFSPGPMFEVDQLIDVDGQPAPDQDGDLFMLTVSLQPVNVYEAIGAGLDPAVDLIDADLVRPSGQTDEEFRIRSLELMESSKRSAIFVALSTLGYEPTLSGEGVVVVDLVESTPAAELLEVGDVIVAIDGDPTALDADAVASIRSRDIGQTITLTVVRGEEEIDVPIELIEHTTELGQPMVGFTPRTFQEAFVFPVDVDNDSSNIGGPSAGLVYTLAVINALTPEDLTNGHLVAGTGTVSTEGGRVGAIGGVRQKVVAAQEAGASIILVPADNFDEAQTVVAEDVDLISVGTVRDALAFLETLPPA